MKKILFLLLVCFAVMIAKSQTSFHPQVKIEFEKTVAMQALFKEIAKDWYERIKDRIPANMTSFFEFTGDTARSIYKKSKEPTFDAKSMYLPATDDNVVYNDYTNGTTVSQKPIFEETFLLQDSMINIKWKLTSDTRTIAGYECRKAIGIMYDTVTVFAFYTDELMVRGGPEGINGLPGMILGMGIPRLHATWFATKVQVFDINMQKTIPPTKGKKVNRQVMLKSMESVLKQWEFGKKMMLSTMI